MIWTALAVLWVLIHAAAYAFCYRDDPLVNSASGIFKYHLRSFGLATAVAAIVGISIDGWGGLPAPFIVAGVHGIYSMTKLEIWALADGGYSASILDAISLNDSVEQQRDTLSQLEKIGDAKRAERLAYFVSAGWVVADESGYRQTRRGHLIGTAVGAARRFFHLKEI